MEPKPQAPDHVNCLAGSRLRSAQMLRENARRLHQEAVGMEQLADWAGALNEAQDEALWLIISRSR